MNANELADNLKLFWHTENDSLFEEAATMLRQKQAEIEALKAELRIWSNSLIKEQQAQIEALKAKTLTDEEIKQIWKESHVNGALEFEIVNIFAKAILRKAQEK
jgi:hypothetical protein